MLHAILLSVLAVTYIPHVAVIVEKVKRALRLRTRMAMSSTDRKREGNPLVDEISDLKRYKREIVPPFAVGRAGGCLEESLALDQVVSGVANGLYGEWVCSNRVLPAWYLRFKKDFVEPRFASM